MDIIVGGDAMPPRKNTLAAAGMWLGIASIFLYEFGGLPIAGVIVSALGLSKAASLGGAGRTKAAWGLGLSVLYTIVYIAKRNT
ncbi:MAG: hypothetical protein ABL986_00160 [Vicinamibacterales bacterium]